MKKIAIIGSGISGLTCAHYLKDRYDLTIFEAADYPGGHTNTIQVKESTQCLQIDTGFIVFNDKTYPNFIALMKALGVERQKTDMSFSVRCEKTGLEYNGTTINSLFAQRLNLLRPSFYRMISGIMKFNQRAKDFLMDPDPEMTFDHFIKKSRLNREVVDHYLIPMTAAIWSADPKATLEFPALFLLQFWQNHGFLEINDRPQWYVIKGGSRTYVDKLLSPIESRLKLKTPITKVQRQRDEVIIHHGGEQDIFDGVIFAVHSNQALSLLDNPTTEERTLLNAIPFQKNTAYLHTDETILPRKKLAWAAWNYHLTRNESHRATVTYNMNILQNLPTKQVYNVTLNPHTQIPPDHTIGVYHYEHPVFTKAGVEQQHASKNFMGQHNTWFCGAWMRNGFHEDGVVSALNVCQSIGEASWARSQPFMKDGSSTLGTSPSRPSSATGSL